MIDDHDRCEWVNVSSGTNSPGINGSFPPSWRQAVVLPIPKVDKDRTDPNSYRPIALTSCLCKVVK